MASALVIAVGGIAWAQGTNPPPATSAIDSQPAFVGPEVTIKGVMMWDLSCVPKPASADDKTLVVFAVDGTPEISATVEDILKACWPGDSLDVDQAQQLNDAFEKRLKYYLVPNEISAKWSKETRYSHPAVAVTGVVSEQDGKRWITAGSIKGNRFTYPAKMLTPDKPFALPGKTPLILKVNDTLTLKCILLPAGAFMASIPFYMYQRWQEDFPHPVTLTRPFYLAEIPVTQEQWESVMTNNPSPLKGPQIPVHNADYADILKFCQVLSEKNGRKVRLPTHAEWEYAARVGTSSPPFPAKYTVQNSTGPKYTLLPVQSRQPNAWGFFDMPSPAWEFMSDAWRAASRVSEIDPLYPLDAKMSKVCGMGVVDIDNRKFCVATHETLLATGKGYAPMKFRVAVDATPEETAGLAKTVKY